MKYLVIGLGITGISTIKTLSKMGYEVYAYDDNIDEKNISEELKNIQYKHIFDLDNLEFKDIICIKSPGIAPNNKSIIKVKNKGIEVISDLEMAYRLFQDKKFIAITGTNGKTTVTMLVNHILNASGKSSMTIGNIGIGMLWEIYNNPDIEYFVIECSSFQLDATSEFRSEIAAISNISPDHLDWHGDFKSYFDAKKKIFKNQKETDYLVLNIDDEKLKNLQNQIKSKLVTISLKKDSALFYLKDNYIYNQEKIILDCDKLQIVGIHNIQNVLIATAICKILGISNIDLAKACYSFKSVEHRIEYVKEIKKVKFYNDSKGTNVDSTSKALEAFNNPIILIAGGYDKKVSFENMFIEYGHKIKKLILMGETAPQMKKEARGIKDITIVNNMREAVEFSYDHMEENDIVLLSPACASWGMYKSYIERGNEFKELVNKLGD